MISDLLVHVDPTEAGRRRLDYAISMAMALQARLTGTHVLAEPDLPPLYKPSVLDEVVSHETERLRELAEASEALFRSATRNTPVTARWRASRGDMAREVARQGRYADLIILGEYEHEGSSLRRPFSLADDVLQSGCRPIIVIPPSVGPCDASRVILAWDGSPQSARAVHDALPLLIRADDIRVLTVLKEGKTTTWDCGHQDLIDHLTRLRAAAYARAARAEARLKPSWTRCGGVWLTCW
jgi:nucleotide-binding universal stress UspA family protein